MLSIHDFATHKCHPIHPIHGPLWTGADPFALSASRVHDENLCPTVSFDHSSCWSTLWRIETDVGSLTRPQSYPLIASDDEMLFSSLWPGFIVHPSYMTIWFIHISFFRVYRSNRNGIRKIHNAVTTIAAGCPSSIPSYIYPGRY